MISQQDLMTFTQLPRNKVQPYPDSAVPLSMSTNAPWSDILRVEKHRLRTGELPEFRLQDHCVAVRLGPPGTIEMRIADERPRRMVARPGDLCFFSQGYRSGLGTSERPSSCLSPSRRAS